MQKEGEKNLSSLTNAIIKEREENQANVEKTRHVLLELAKLEEIMKMNPKMKTKTLVTTRKRLNGVMNHLNSR